MALFLVGIGINPPASITLEAIETVRKSSAIFLEQYTNDLPSSLARELGDLFGKKITVLPRECVEDEKIIIEAARTCDCCLLVAGDPLVATTHISLLICAKKQKIKTKVIHSSSILSAAASESGLQAYKFGATTTIPHFRENYKPTSFLSAIAANKKLGLHTLCLLDIDAKLGPLTPSQGCKNALICQKKKKQKVLLPSTKIIVLSRLGQPEGKVIYSSIAKIIEGQEMFGLEASPACLVIPGKLHFIEEEFLQLADSV